jgi:hypothetical protein
MVAPFLQNPEDPPRSACNVDEILVIGELAILELEGKIKGPDRPLNSTKMISITNTSSHCGYVCPEIMTSSRAISFRQVRDVTNEHDFVDLLRYMWAFSACKCYTI